MFRIKGPESRPRRYVRAQVQPIKQPQLEAASGNFTLYITENVKEKMLSKSEDVYAGRSTI